MHKPLPLDLPRLVMRRAVGVGGVALLLAAVLGLVRVGDNIEDEVDAALALARVMARVGALPQADDRVAIAALRETLAEGGLRHLELHILDDHGRTLLRPLPPQPDNAWLGWLYEAHRRLLSQPDRRRVNWQVARPGGGLWTVSLSASHESERIEALNNLAGALALLLGCIGALLVVMAWNVRRAFAPLAGLLAAIERIEHHDPEGVRRLPAMPTRELEAIAAALRHLVAGLDRAEAERRLLSQKVLTLQEDERTHLARELHDEFGQRLTALRLDATWLARRLGADAAEPAAPTAPERSADQAERLTVVQGMAERCAEVQRDIRDLLLRLRPLGPAGDASQGPDGDTLPLARLVQLLEGLIQGWQDSGRRSDAPPAALQLSVDTAAPDGHTQPLPPATAETTALPRDLALAVYRLSQEALTNVARHARATRVDLRLTLQHGVDGRPAALLWQVRDDGVGIADAQQALQRGNGLGGMQERVWALGGRWTFDAAGPPAQSGARHGLVLRAELPLASLASLPSLSSPPPRPATDPHPDPNQDLPT